MPIIIGLIRILALLGGVCLFAYSYGFLRDARRPLDLSKAHSLTERAEEIERPGSSFVFGCGLFIVALALVLAAVFFHL